MNQKLICLCFSLLFLTAAAVSEAAIGRYRPFQIFDVPDSDSDYQPFRSYSRDNPINQSSTRPPSNMTRRGQLSCRNPNTSFDCLACNCVNEAAPRWDDQLAVSKVVMTRFRLPQYPKTICGVVKQRLQFSWYNQMSTRRSVPANHACFTAATEALKFTGYFADHYHANYVSPKWRHNMKKVGQIGVHIYYSNSSPSQIQTGGSTIEV